MMTSEIDTTETTSVAATNTASALAARSRGPTCHSHLDKRHEYETELNELNIWIPTKLLTV